MMKKWLLLMLLSLSVCGVNAGEVVRLYPQKADASAQEKSEWVKNENCFYYRSVLTPTLEIFPLTDSPKAPWMIICPGGGYQVLAYNKEGTDVAKFLNQEGFSAAVLKYSLAGDRAAALNDAHAALTFLRHRQPGVKIGMMGFSAGAHLTASAACSDTAPDFIGLIYPAYIGDNSLNPDPGLKFSGKVPPSFVVQTQDDHAFVFSTLTWAKEMTRLNRPAEVHLYPNGGHGYGIRSTAHGLRDWPQNFIKWLKTVSR